LQATSFIFLFAKSGCAADTIFHQSQGGWIIRQLRDLCLATADGSGCRCQAIGSFATADVASADLRAPADGLRETRCGRSKRSQRLDRNRSFISATYARIRCVLPRVLFIFEQQQFREA
jgi:hypothetical protein